MAGNKKSIGLVSLEERMSGCTDTHIIQIQPLHAFVVQPTPYECGITMLGTHSVHAKQQPSESNRIMHKCVTTQLLARQLLRDEVPHTLGMPERR